MTVAFRYAPALLCPSSSTTDKTADIYKRFEASFTCYFLMAAWRGGNALSQINDVILRRARLVLKWVTVCGTKPSQLSRLSLLPSVGW